MMKFAVPYDDGDYGDTDVWHSLTAALQQFRAIPPLQALQGEVLFTQENQEVVSYFLRVWLGYFFS